MLHHSDNGHRRARVDHPIPLVNEALSALLASAGFTVVSRTDARSAVDLAVVGADFTRSAPHVIAVVDAGDVGAQRAAVARGVAAVITTTAPIDRFRACIDTVAGGGRWQDPDIAGEDVSDNVAAGISGPALTRRERDVASLVAAGQRNRTIAATLGISEGTVKMHLHNVYAKLGLESRTQLAMDTRART